jgi:hypothetical protein
MPYIKDRRQAALNSPVTAGELNYSFTRLMIDAWAARETMTGLSPNFGMWLRDRMDWYVENLKIHNSILSYSTINDILGAMAGATMEFNRRVPITNTADAKWLHLLMKVNSRVVHEFYNDVAVPYEIKRCKENGDVYPI